jgi:UDP-hydrolysing UDP-N-acetyl-D-glucosamine 2-epimerase
MAAVQQRKGLELQVLAAGTMVLERFQQPVTIVRGDGFPVDGQIYMELEGSTPTTMAKSVGFGIVEFCNEFQRLRPDIVLLIGDRYEALAAAIAAAYMNLCIVHIQGGEVSGSIDESARHAITKFAHFHVPSTKRAAEYLMRMGERPDTILTIGCPSSDIATGMNGTLTADVVNGSGSGAFIDPARPFLLTVFHPTTTEYGCEADQMRTLLEALSSIRMPTLLLWPNIDAGSDHISKTIRVFRDRNEGHSWLRARTNMNPSDYLQVLKGTTCAVGNSSSFVRDAGYFGTPVVLIGNRQDGREHDRHVVCVRPTRDDIEHAIHSQMKTGRYPPSALYGDGGVSQRIAEGLVHLVPYIQKKLHFVSGEAHARQEERERLLPTSPRTNWKNAV